MWEQYSAAGRPSCGGIPYHPCFPNHGGARYHLKRAGRILAGCGGNVGEKQVNRVRIAVSLGKWMVLVSPDGVCALPNGVRVNELLTVLKRQ